jgi:hypothetical protein
MLKILYTHKFLDLKNVRKKEENFSRILQKSKKFLDPNIFGCQKF